MLSTSINNPVIKRTAYADYFGPCVPGMIAFCGYWHEEFRVERSSILLSWVNGKPQANGWAIQVTWLKSGRKTTHCTAWDKYRDHVVSYPCPLCGCSSDVPNCFASICQTCLESDYLLSVLSEQTVIA